ncbi:hypothetical protein DFH29DRAFT_1033341 [Suillus ampliporus]|nr:hypothetical protein DFH29DRAFT_1033341 [Suillus ampliporus]
MHICIIWYIAMFTACMNPSKFVRCTAANLRAYKVAISMMHFRGATDGACISNWLLSHKTSLTPPVANPSHSTEPLKSRKCFKMSMIAKKGRQQGQEGYDATGAICPVCLMDPTWHRHWSKSRTTAHWMVVMWMMIALLAIHLPTFLIIRSGQISTPKVEKSAESQMNFSDVVMSSLLSESMHRIKLRLIISVFLDIHECVMTWNTTKPLLESTMRKFLSLMLVDVTNAYKKQTNLHQTPLRDIVSTHTHLNLTLRIHYRLHLWYLGNWEPVGPGVSVVLGVSWDYVAKNGSLLMNMVP